MAATEPNHSFDEDEFQAFLEEIEQLSIKHSGHDEANNERTPDESGTAASVDEEDKIVLNTSSTIKDNDAATTNNTDEGDRFKTSKSHRKSIINLSRQDKKSMIQCADNNQRSWTEFKKSDPSRATGDDEGDAITSNVESKPKISFQIMNANDKKKKKKKNKIIDSAENSSISEWAVDSNTEIQKRKTNFNDGYYKSPRWTIVVDTCCLVHDNGKDVQTLIDLASRASTARFIAQQQHLNMALGTTYVEEQIEIVIPYKVWSELEYQSKSQDSKIAFSARAVIRMLRDELAHSGFVGNQGIMNNSPREDIIVRSQSLVQSGEAARKFLSLDMASLPPTNDDHILACALTEYERWNDMTCNIGHGTTVTAGGVIVLTTDNNLACKAYANGLKVETPYKFREYYVTRMASLRKRGNLTKSCQDR